VATEEKPCGDDENAAAPADERTKFRITCEVANFGDLATNGQNLKLSVRFATALNQPIGTIPDYKEGKSSASDRSRRAMDAAILPISFPPTLIDPIVGRKRGTIEHISGGSDTR
jgi:hypothetical protein